MSEPTREQVEQAKQFRFRRKIDGPADVEIFFDLEKGTCGYTVVLIADSQMKKLWETSGSELPFEEFKKFPEWYASDKQWNGVLLKWGGLLAIVMLVGFHLTFNSWENSKLLAEGLAIILFGFYAVGLYFAKN